MGLPPSDGDQRHGSGEAGRRGGTSVAAGPVKTENPFETGRNTLKSPHGSTWMTQPGVRMTFVFQIPHSWFGSTSMISESAHLSPHLPTQSLWTAEVCGCRGVPIGECLQDTQGGRMNPTRQKVMKVIYVYNYNIYTVVAE